MASPNRSDIDNPQTWATFKAFILALWDQSAAAEGFQLAAGKSAIAASGSATAAAASAAVSDVAGNATKAINASLVAQSSASAAQSARDAALIQAGVYVDEPTGRAAVADGAAFKVQGVAEIAAFEYRRVNANTNSTLIATYPAAAAIAFKQQTNASLLMLSDGDGNAIVRVDAPVSIASAFSVDSVGSLGTSALALSKKTLRSRLGLSDTDGNLALEVNEKGQLVADLSLYIKPSYKTAGVYDYEINHVFTYGQSLSVGQATPAISTVQKYDNVMFVQGMRPQYDYPNQTPAQWYASLIPAIESQSPTQSSLAETPSMGTGDAIKERILAEDGLAFGTMKYQLLLSAPGYGAQTIAQLSKGAGTGHYERMISQAGYGLSLANAAGKTYAAQAVTWMQGESDYLNSTTQANYVTALNTLIANLNTDFQAATGQAKSVQLISYQLASHKVNGQSVPSIALALLQVDTTNPLAHLSTPMYHFEYQDANNNHLTSTSSRWLGAYHGLAYKRVVIDGINWQPCKPLSSIKQGAIAVIKFNVPSGRLTLDTTNVAINTNYGFELVDSTGAALAISKVALMGPDTVKVIASATIPAGARLRYAWSGAGNVGSVVGPRGNLRDSQGDTIIFDPQGINKPMHNWCVIFEIGL